MIQITDFLTSRQNDKVKQLVQLQKHNERIKQDRFIIEGIREIEKAIDSGYQFGAVFFVPKLIETDKIATLFGTSLPAKIYQINEDVYSKIAYRENSGGIIALTKPKIHELNTLASNLSANPLILVIEGVEKPGNIGAIYRTADAAGLDGIIICDSKTDLYNPNIIRASLGCVFTVPTAISNSHNAVQWLTEHKIIIYCTSLDKAVQYHTIDYTKPSAIVMGTEATGVSNIWLEVSDSNIIIPMRGKTDSMNVSTSAAIIIFEACRQRNFDQNRMN